MSVDIYNSRRCNYHRCEYWLRDEKGLNDEDELIHNKKPNGVFYAKEIEEITKDTREFANAFQVDITNVRLETSDNVDGLDKNALVRYCGDIYIVEYVREKHIHKREEFGCKQSKISYIYLRK